MTTLPSQSDAATQEPLHEEHHGDFRLFGLATFLVADGMTLSLIHI